MVIKNIQKLPACPLKHLVVRLHHALYFFLHHALYFFSKTNKVNQEKLLNIVQKLQIGKISLATKLTTLILVKEDLLKAF